MTTEERDPESGEPEAGRKDDPGTAFTHDAPAAAASSTLRLHPDAAEAREGSAVLGWLAIASIVVLIGAGMQLAFGWDRGGAGPFWLGAIGPVVLVAAYALLRAARDGVLAQMVRPVWGDATRGIGSAALLVAAAMALVHVIAPVASPRVAWTARVYLVLGDPRWLRVHASTVAGVVLLVAAAEEIVWRGLVTRLIAERAGSRHAWVWAAVAYALAQVPTMWALRDPEAGLNPLIVLAALGCGLAWGAMARWTGRLIPSFLSHMAFDWCVIMVFPLWGFGA